MKITTFNNKLLSAVNRSSHNLYKKINSIVETAYLRFIGVKIQGGGNFVAGHLSFSQMIL